VRSLDPAVQVAAFGVIATIVSTVGVVIAAYINKSSPTAIKHEEPEHDDHDQELVRLMLDQAQTISQLKATNEDLEAENVELRAHREHCRRNHADPA
jgi:cell division protein FtsL